MVSSFFMQNTVQLTKRMIHFAAQSVQKWQFCGLLKFAQKGVFELILG